MSGDNQSADSSLVTLYHYTNQKALMGIAKSRTIRASTDIQNDAAFGKGAYATTYGPNNSKAKIAKNNYDGAWQKNESQGKVDHCIEYKVRKSNVERAQVKDRDVWVHKGSVDLANAKDVKYHIRQNDGTFKTLEDKRKGQQELVPSTPNLRAKPITPNIQLPKLANLQQESLFLPMISTRTYLFNQNDQISKLMKDQEHLPLAFHPLYAFWR